MDAPGAAASAGAAAAAQVHPRRPARSLARHLFLTYLLLTLVATGAIALLSLWTVGTLETHLQRIDMGMAVERVRTAYLAGEDVGRADRFFHGAPGSDAFPDWLRHLAPGFHKIQRDGRAWHVMASDQDGVRYMLLRDYTDYEQGLRRSHWLTVAAVAASLLLAFLLGTLAARRVLRPLARLATQMSVRGGLPPRTRLAQGYPRDEIGQLAAAFDDTYNQLEQALEREQLFTADVSHELRTPLMVVSSSSEVLLDDANLSASQTAQLHRIQAAARDMHQHLDAYLMLARGRADASGFPQTTVLAAAQEQVAHWLPRAQRLGVTLAWQEVAAADRSGSGSTATAAMPTYPAPLLRIVLSNLIRNALQHATGARHVTVLAGPGTMEVRDDGAGIPPDRQESAFAPFVQGRKGGPENLGLGLSLIQRICNHQHWQVTLESAADRGSRFHVDLSGN
ncbi:MULTISPECIES: HAMP domain-containing sensor histidine kinase [unclassified Achromobacter]|uniref:sensor histidine kinase n=1 Tax=unclassified Achromobacter TaxID=2626865 RepID=UPI000B517111|nr:MULTISPECIES: HAMP domain-containing sensor histidine kinase [unclassified Achromobacter]OWT68262.1 two-component sensor histidine kinase [Achromobacter sp. HZ34]OWT70099.1 two-component sensor histidine kinase [Achromobacter sp. HZ28]